MSDPLPTYDTAESQAERTALAWSRTLVGGSALVGFIGVHASIGGASPAVLVAIGVLAAVVLLTSSLVARLTWSRATTALAGTRAATAPLTLGIASAATVLIATASIAVIFGSWI